MTASVTVKGFVATQPKFVIVGDNLAITSFRLGTSTRRLNQTSNQWETTNTSWFSISCFRELATNAFASLNKGDPIVVTGVLKVSEWAAGDKSGLDVEITADSIGHDLRWGKAKGFARTPAKRGGQHDGEREEEADQPAEPSGLPPAAEGSGWPNPLESFGTASVADSGEPIPALDLTASGDAAELPDDAIASAPF